MNLVDLMLWRTFDTPLVRAAARTLGGALMLCVLLAAVSQANGTPVSQDHASNGSPADPSASMDDAPAVSDFVNASAAVDPTELAAIDQAHGDTPGMDEIVRYASPQNPAPVFARAARLEERLAYFSKVGVENWLGGDREGAEEAFAKALNVNLPPVHKRELLLRMAELYELDDQPVKAIAALEKLQAALPDDPDVPEILLRLGILYREIGAYEMAGRRLFQVLNSTLSKSPEEFEAGRKLAMKARLEIAEMHAMKGEVEEASRYYSRLQLLDLNESDAETVRFREAQLQFRLENWTKAVDQLGVFVADYPNSRRVAEARYLRCKAFERLERRDEALQEVVTLLGSSPADPSDTVDLAHWKRRSGNELANEFYERGDFHGALSVYQALARASAEPSWRWPAVYQVGLCFERLNLPHRAAEAYQLIVSRNSAGESNEPLSEALSALQSMANWRLGHLEWIEEFENRVHVLTATSGT